MFQTPLSNPYDVSITFPSQYSTSDNQSQECRSRCLSYTFCCINVIISSTLSGIRRGYGCQNNTSEKELIILAFKMTNVVYPHLSAWIVTVSIPVYMTDTMWKFLKLWNIPPPRRVRLFIEEIVWLLLRYIVLDHLGEAKYMHRLLLSIQWPWDHGWGKTVRKACLDVIIWNLQDVPLNEYMEKLG